jgi:hypothetical protein
MATKAGIGFIGVGMMGQMAHLANYVRLRDEGECEIAGVTDLKPLLASYSGFYSIEMFNEELWKIPVTEAAFLCYSSLLPLCKE